MAWLAEPCAQTRIALGGGKSKVVGGKVGWWGGGKKAMGGFKSRDSRVCRIARFLRVSGVVIHWCFWGYGFGGWAKQRASVRANN